MSMATRAPGAAPEVRTRGWFRREYESSLAPGEEAAALAAVRAERDAAAARLRALRARRVDLARRSAEHVRKLADWKGKVPRALGAAIPDGPGAAGSGAMPWVAIAEVRRRGEGELALVFVKRFVRGLEGVERFSKIWVLAVPEVAAVAQSVDGGSDACAGRGWGNDAFVMVLVDVVGRVGRGVRDKEVVVVRDGGGDALEQLMGATVIDIKPYLSYCEAHAGEGAGGPDGPRLDGAPAGTDSGVGAEV